MAKKRGKRKATRRTARTARRSAKRTVRRKHKRAARKSKAAPKKAVKAAPAKQAKQKTVGLVTHFYPHISVGIVEVKSPLKLGDSVTITGHGRTFKQKITSMQIEHESISAAKKGDIIGMKVVKPVKEKDVVMK